MSIFNIAKKITNWATKGTHRYSPSLSLLFLILCGFLPLNEAQALTMNCSNAEGTLIHQLWVREGGPAPYPGEVLSKSSWKFKGKEIAEPIHFQFHQETRQLLHEERHPVWNLQVYTIKVTLSRPDGGPLVQDGDTKLYNLEDTVLCKRHSALIP